METFAEQPALSERNQQPCSAGLRFLGFISLLVTCVVVALGGLLIAALWLAHCWSLSFMLHTR